MPITADCHLHSSFSGDSDTPMEAMIQQGVAQGLTTMCFTEHNDFAYPDTPDGPGSIFLLNTDSYLYELIRCKEKYADRIRILFGVEMGLQPHLMRQDAIYAKSYDFDFIIGSTHLCQGKDPYYPDFFEGRTKKEALQAYFADTLQNIRKHSNFDVYGHLDYIVRVAPGKDEGYSFAGYRELLDPILELLIEKGKGLEVNTGGVKYGLKELHPCMDILKRYQELGGEIITVGSDAHDPKAVAAHFDRAAEYLKACGFRYYTVFEKRSPEFHKL